MQRVDDEPFWRAQEQRRDRELGQPCCTQSGISWSLLDMPGRFAVVIHGEYDCVNCFRHNEGRSSWQYYSTRLTEGQLTSGETAEPLQRCLELIAEHEQPDAVVVLGTCPVEVIGDQFDIVVDKVSAKTGIPMVALHTSGLKLSTQQNMMDWCFDTLASLGEAESSSPPKGSSRLALVGMPTQGRNSAELRSVIDTDSLDFLASFPDAAQLQDWRRLTDCDTVVVSDREMFPRLMDRLEQANVSIVEAPLPYGLSQSSAVYAQILQETGTGDSPHLASLRERNQSAVDKFRNKWAGTSVALTIRMFNNNQLNMVARDGLGQVQLFTELGFNVTVLIQGSPDPSMRHVWAEQLAQHDLDIDFDVFAGPYAVGDCLRRGHYDLACVADWVHQQVAATGIPTIFANHLQAWFEGIVPNLQQIEHALGMQK